jgi:hypothetical protein
MAGLGGWLTSLRGGGPKPKRIAACAASPVIIM